LTTPQVQGVWDRFKGTLGRYWTPISKREVVFSDPIAEARRLERLKKRKAQWDLILRELMFNPSLVTERATKGTERATKGWEYRTVGSRDRNWYYLQSDEPSVLKNKPVGTVYSSENAEFRVPSRAVQLQHKQQQQQLLWESLQARKRFEEPQPARYWQE
jgi:hypothetical protein